jgi:hypothetical protein
MLKTKSGRAPLLQELLACFVLPLTSISAHCKKGTTRMRKKTLLLTMTAFFLTAVGALAQYGLRTTRAYAETKTSADRFEPLVAAEENGFSVEVLIDGQPVAEYAAPGRRYVETIQNAEYELRIHNPTGSRVAVALSVDGLNTIDARHTSAWEAHKWVIEPFATISVRGWQMSSENARRFYFTTERDSYAAKLGQAANLGVISAVFFRERKPFVILPVTPGPPRTNDKGAPAKRSQQPNAQSGSAEESLRVDRDVAKTNIPAYPPPDDESAATGIGRSVRNDVQWIKMDLETRPAADVTIRYEYRAALVRLGIIPRDYPRQDVLERRERAQGFDPRYCPAP